MVYFWHRKLTYMNRRRLTRSPVVAGLGHPRPDSLFLQVMSDRSSQYQSGERAQRSRDMLTLHYVVTGCKSGWRHQLFKELIRTGPADAQGRTYVHGLLINLITACLHFGMTHKRLYFTWVLQLQNVFLTQPRTSIQKQPIYKIT